MKPHWDLVLLGCGDDKAPSRCCAIDLYTGPVFKAHREIVEALGVPVDGILSAKWRLLDPDEQVDPYSQTTPSQAWHEDVAEQLLAAVHQHQLVDPVVLVLAGPLYVAGWKKLVAGDVTVDDPLQGLMVGERRQLAWEVSVHGALPPLRHRPVRQYLFDKASDFIPRARARRRQA